MEPNVKDVAGRAVSVLAMLDALRAPGGLGNMMVQRQAALSDPNFRAGLVDSPFTAGFFGVGGSRVPEVPPGIAQRRISEAGFTPGQWVPNLPPLGPQGQIQQQQMRSAISGLHSQDAATRVTARHFLKLMADPADDQTVSDAAQANLKPGQSTTIKTSLGSSTYSKPNESDKPGVAPVGATLFTQNGIQYAKTKDGKIIRMGSIPQQPADTKSLLGLLGMLPPAQAQAATPRAGSVPPPGAPSAPPAQAAPQGLPGDDTPLSALPLFGGDDGSIAYPSPAFDSAAGQAPATRPPVAPAAPAAGLMQQPLQPGQSRTLSVGPKGLTGSESQKGPPIAGAQAAQVQKSLSLLTTAPQAAETALRMVTAGPQHPVTVFGQNVYQPDTFAGPVTGPVLHELSKVQGARLQMNPDGTLKTGATDIQNLPDLGTETATLEAYIAHAKSGILSLLGARWTPDQQALFEPLLPDISQPTGVLQVHLARLATFYRQLGSMQGALTNLNDDQKQAVMTSLFTSTMGGATDPVTTPQAPPTPRPGAVLDLR